MNAKMFSRKCDWCENVEERVWTDSWTGTDLCIECLLLALPALTFSPSEGDTLRTALQARCADRRDEEELPWSLQWEEDLHGQR